MAVHGTDVVGGHLLITGKYRALVRLLLLVLLLPLLLLRAARGGERVKN
jgi:hypothetical protein